MHAPVSQLLQLHSQVRSLLQLHSQVKLLLQRYVQVKDLVKILVQVHAPAETEWEEAEEASDVVVRLAEPVLTPSR